jgi:HD-GYP domain-containing protein (c-di-GMP phosphodiesterase class II)
VFAVADALDAMTSDRPYRKAMAWEAAREEIVAQSGRQFDPAVVEAFLAIPDARWRELQSGTLPAAAAIA